MLFDDKDRIRETERAFLKHSRFVRVLQDAAHGLIAEYIAGKIITDDKGKIQYNARNLRVAQGVYRVFEKFQKRFEKTMLGRFLEWAGDIFGLNQRYFERMDKNTDSVRDQAIRQTLLRWGYDNRRGELVAGGWLERIFANTGIAQRVASLLNQAVSVKLPLSDFLKNFRAVFVAKAGAGMLERHFNTNAFDLYQRIDRTINFIYAERLGLTNAIYSGTLEADSRPFCIERVNKIYSLSQIQSWKKLDFQGKPKVGYEPVFDCGGFNCRHHLSWISDEIAEKLKQ